MPASPTAIVPQSSGLLFEKTTTGASTCILVGPPPTGLTLKSCQRLLWCADRASLALPGLASAAAEVVAIDEVASAEFVPILERFLSRDPRRLPSLFVGAGVLTQHVARYDALLAEIHAALESHGRARVTRQKDGFTWQKHVLQNAATYAHRRLPPTWAGALRGFPAFVCGAGPSLDASIGQLATHADRAVVFAADSALRALAKQGVRADFAVSIDPAKAPEKCLPITASIPPLAAGKIAVGTRAAASGHASADYTPQRVVLSPISPAAWQTALPAEPPVYLSNNQLTIDWLAAQGIARTPVSAQENCGSTALELARYLGCSPIYLFGLDLAASGDNRRHHAAVDATIYANSGYDAAQQAPHVPGNYVDSLPTFVYGDWRALNERLGGWPAGLVCNVNDRGARLQNTTLVHPGRFEFGGGAADKHAALARLPAPRALARDAWLAAATGLHRTHRVLREALPRLHLALEASGPATLIGELRKLFRDPTLSATLGAFSFKLMPHLVPPIEGDTVFWRSLLHELETLAALANTDTATP